MYNLLINNEKQTKFPWRSLLRKGVLSGGRLQNLNSEKPAEGDMGMEWNTVYLRGKSNFENEVRHNLEHNGFRFMPGFSHEKGLALYWIEDKQCLREFKKAIGSKTVFKYRLRFYNSIEEFVESKHNASTLREPLRSSL
ncbi:MAG TPA: hypothetical protein VIU12_12880 [Chryseolinea sp.]